jgi:hypothetical protein
MMNWKEFRRQRSWPTLRYYPGIHLKGLTKTTRNLSQDSLSPVRDFNPGPPEYESGVLTTRPRRLIKTHMNVVTVSKGEKLHAVVTDDSPTALPFSGRRNWPSQHSPMTPNCCGVRCCVPASPAADPDTVERTDPCRWRLRTPGLALRRTSARNSTGLGNSSLQTASRTPPPYRLKSNTQA